LWAKNFVVLDIQKKPGGSPAPTPDPPRQAARKEKGQGGEGREPQKKKKKTSATITLLCKERPIKPEKTPWSPQCKKWAVTPQEKKHRKPKKGQETGTSCRRRGGKGQ